MVLKPYAVMYLLTTRIINDILGTKTVYKRGISRPETFNQVMSF